MQQLSGLDNSFLNMEAGGQHGHVGSLCFYDVSGLVVLRERVPIVKTPLKPGETKEFRLPFEGVPPSWNQTMPQLVIAHIAFSG